MPIRTLYLPRAVGDALPFLIGAEVVKIVTYDAETSAVGHGADPGPDVGLYLSRNGCKVEVHARDSGDVGVADCILSFLVEQGSDLLVMGAYSQSRFREKVFGGVTERVLSDASSKARLVSVVWTAPPPTSPKGPSRNASNSLVALPGGRVMICALCVLLPRIDCRPGRRESRWPGSGSCRRRARQAGRK